MIENDFPDGWKAGPISDDNIQKWKATIIGPIDSPYEGGHFELDITIPDAYPLRPPSCRFVTQIFHPNVDEGSICLDILDSAWTAAYSIKTMLLSISLLMVDPNADDPMDGESADLYQTNREEYNRRAREMTKEHAMPKVEITQLSAEKEDEQSISGSMDQSRAEEDTLTIMQDATTAVATEEAELTPVSRPARLTRRQSSIYELIQQHSHVDENELDVVSDTETVDGDDELILPTSTVDANLDISEPIEQVQTEISNISVSGNVER